MEILILCGLAWLAIVIIEKIAKKINASVSNATNRVKEAFKGNDDRINSDNSNSLWSLFEPVEQKKVARTDIPFRFSKAVTHDDFNEIAFRARKHIKRIVSYEVNGPIVEGVVRTQSGQSFWRFSIDFNDYGKITGEYWIYRENYDSGIPKIIAERMQSEIIKKRRAYKLKKAMDAWFE